MKIKQIIIVFVTAFLWSVSCLAQENYTLDKVIVKAKKEASCENTVKNIKIQDEAKPVISSIPDILEHTSGMDIQHRGILTPKNSQVRIRGLDERRSLIMLDGRPLNGTGVMGGQFVDWSSISTMGWESVSVGKGAFSAKYGNTLGGTINMIPVMPDKPEFNIFTGYQRYNTFSAGASGSGKFGPFGTQLSYGYNETDGNLRNSEAQRHDFSGRFYYSWGDDGQIQAGVRYIDGEFNMPVLNQEELAGFDNDFPESAGSYLVGPGIKFPGQDRHGDGSFYTKERYELDFGIKKKIFNIDSELKFYFNNEDRIDTIYSYNNKDIVLKREATPDRSWGWVSRFSKMFDSHLLGFGADGNYLGYGGSDNIFIKDNYFQKPPSNGSDEWDGTRWHGIYIDDQWMALDNLDIYFGLRYDNYYGDRKVDAVTGYKNGKPAGFEHVNAEFDEDVFLPKLSLTYRAFEGISIHGRFARATRYPDNPAFYWYYGGYRPEVDPNSDVVRKELTYEDALQYEAGINYSKIPGFLISCNYYHYVVDDYIRWIFGYSPSRVVYNIDQVKLQGIELDLDGKIWRDIYAFASFTWQKTKKQGDVLDSSNSLTDELSELPDVKFSLGLKYKRKDGAMAKIALRWVDTREVPFIGEPGAPYSGDDAPDGTPIGSNMTLKELDDFATMDILLKYPVWNKGFKGFLTGGVTNLFDVDYEEEYGFPEPGQTFSIGAEIKF